METKKKNLAFFLTKGMSLQQWDALGMLDREVDYYRALAKYFHRVFIFSYGADIDQVYKNRFGSNVEIVTKKKWLPNIVYQYLLPLMHWRVLTTCTFLKTNQIYAAIPAIIAKIIFPKKKLIVRAGYIASYFAQRNVQRFFGSVSTSTVEYIAYRLCDVAFIPTEEGIRFLLQKYPFLQRRLYQLNNAINADVFRPLPVAEQYDIGYVGRLEESQKNLTHLLIALDGLPVKVCFIGQGQDAESYRRLAREHQIDLTIINRVSNNELPEYYNKFKIFVLPSLFEGNPKTLLEALSCARPVIGCKVEGVQNIIQSLPDGILVNPDVDSLRAAIIRLLGDTAQRQKIGQQGRALIQKQYALDSIIKLEIHAYEILA